MLSGFDEIVATGGRRAAIDSSAPRFDAEAGDAATNAFVAAFNDILLIGAMVLSTSAALTLALVRRSDLVDTPNREVVMGMRPASTPRELIRDWYATLATGDVARALAAFDPDIEWIEAESSPYGGRAPIRGPEAVLRGVWLPLRREWECIAIEPAELIELPSGVLALVRYRGVRRGTGARLDAQAAHLWDVEGGRITRYRGFADTYALQLATAPNPNHDAEE